MGELCGLAVLVSGNGNVGYQGPEALREVALEALGLAVFVTGCMVS